MQKLNDFHSFLHVADADAAYSDDAAAAAAGADDDYGVDDGDGDGADRKRLSWFCAPLVCAATPANRQ